MLQAVKETKTVEKIIYTSSFFALGPTDGVIADENQVRRALYSLELISQLVFVFCSLKFNCTYRFIMRDFSARNMRNRRLLPIR